MNLEHSLALSPSSTLQQQRIEELERYVAERDAEHMALLERMHELEGLHDDRQAEAEALRRVGEAVGALFDLEEMLRVVTGIAVHVTSTESSQVYLLNDSPRGAGPARRR